MGIKPSRNDPCPCGSGKKYKHCCEGKAPPRPAAPPPAELNQLIVLYNAGRYAELESRARLLVEQFPASAFAWKLLGGALLMQGKEALPAFQKTVELLPDDAEAHCNLGNALKAAGQLEKAVASYQHALRIKPNHNEARHNMGIALYGLGRYDEAVASFRRAVEVEPGLAVAHSNLGQALNELGRFDEAAASCRRALQSDPRSAETYVNLGRALQGLGQFGEAADSYRRALAINPGYAEAHSNLGSTLNDLGQFEDAMASCQRALKLKPDLAAAYINLGNAQHLLGQYNDSLKSYRHALKLNPDSAEVYFNMGNPLKDLGQNEEAVASYRRALELKPDFAKAHNNLLMTLNYIVEQSPSSNLAEARRYGELVSAKVTSRFSTWRCSAQPERLRVGMVSGDMYNHPVGYFLESLLPQLDPSRVELIAYPTDTRADELTKRIKSCFSAWKPLAGLNDEAAAHLIHADGVHVLIDLSGHTSHNRLPVFAWKPAPVQLTWIGYPATTGVAEMDYVLGDPVAIPVQDEGHFSEKVWRLPHSYLCFTPPDAAVEVSPLPALTAGFVTFASFNNLTKTSDAAVAVWARVLQAVPGSRLFLKTRQLQDAAVSAMTRQRFATHGIGEEQLILEGWAAQRADHLAAYRRVDIALDPFPYCGVTTSVEALWMGVPVVTLQGDRFLSRTAESIAHNAGLMDWVARDEDDYVAKAVSKASDLPRLAALRASLRQQVLASPLFDAPRFARNVEEALWGMWQAPIKQP